MTAGWPDRVVIACSWSLRIVSMYSRSSIATSKQGALKSNADLLIPMLQKRGFDSRPLTVEGANAVVFGEVNTPNAKHTIVFYAHTTASL